MKLLILNDPHVSARAPESRTDNYMETMCNKLSEVVQIANEQGVASIAVTGDFFHYKDPTRSPHRLVIAVMKILKKAKCQIFTVLGNHDLEGGSFQSLNEQPIGELVESGIVKLAPSVRFMAGSRQVVLSFHHHFYNRPLQFLEEIESQQRDPEVVYIECVHAGLVPHGMPIYEDMADIETIWHRGLWDVVCSGHIHNDLGILFHADSGRFFANVGAISRGTIAESNLTRIPQVLLIEVEDNTGKITLTPIPLKTARPSAEVFQIEKYQEKKELAQRFQSFVHFVSQSMEVTSSKTIEQVVEEFFEKRNVEPELRQEVRNYLAKAA